MTERDRTQHGGCPAGTAGEDRAAARAVRSDPAHFAAARQRLLRDGARPGPPRRAALAALTDRWLAALWEAAVRDTGARGAALVAVGGHGRGELSPHSDLDLLLLHDGTTGPGGLSRLADRLWYPVWDLGIALDHSVRTPAEARRTAAGDLKVRLGLLDARHVAGEVALTAALRAAALADWRACAPAGLPALREMCREREERHGELSHLLEPDLKEARGGLRDTTVLRAVAASWIADAPRRGLDEARTALLDVRDALHLATGRAGDRLVLQEQDRVARTLGLPDADALLRRVYGAARTVAYASDVTWREVGGVLRARRAPSRRGLPGRTRPAGARTAADRTVADRTAAARRSPLAEGVVEHDGEAVLARTARPGLDPVLPLRAAAAAARAGLPLSPHAVRRLAAEAVPLPVPWPAEAREQLLALLGAGRNAVAVWEALEAEGLVTRMLPEWERVRCLPQRNAVHRWTVDRHLVETAVHAAGLTRRVGRPDLLLAAALLHDIGKGLPGDHSTAGEAVARGVAARMGFPPPDTDVLALLVRHHLLLVDTATRRDLDDPGTVAAVAGAVGGVEVLELLHALTEADALATGPAAWSTWRASLVADLAGRTAAALAGKPVPAPAAPALPAEAERLAAEAVRTGGPVLTVRTHRPPAGHGAARGAAHGEGEGAGPVGAELLLAVPDRPGLLGTAAGVLALHRLTVRAADLRTADPAERGPVLLLTWRVEAEYGSLPDAARLRKDLERALDGSLDVARRLAEREAARPRRRGAAPPPPVATVVPDVSRTATVVEVRAHDAPGLLHRIGHALERAGASVRSARVSTLGADAVDAFYVVGEDGAPLPEPHAARVAAAVQKALA
ncbi:[protein-PII] uridylyltransferase [Streptomyces sp. HB2AG]|uniref:[protein-PII] uridylyltransferase n=1 Tax=Streptomyces sp. HB2AG TaxID=2983400 RepID=UPI0022AB495D|nr:[protein-PII] uridylyltransferase [Streptomyces sp. HB2AG]MCZ2524402.1 [protein-PII] uridylyltransferase [Streptomyces sp. HB2AG]